MNNNDVELNQKFNLVSECFKGISKKQIEEFFGIRVLLNSDNPKECYKYNIYKGDKLIFAKMASWDVEYILNDFSSRCAMLLCNSAEKDKDTEATSKKAE